MFLNLRKDICGKLTINIIVYGERPNAFSEDEEQGKDATVTTPIQYHAGGLSQCNKT